MTLKELQPSLDYDDNRAKSRVYLKDGEFTVYVNEDSLAALRWSLWWLAADAPHGEDISVWSSLGTQLADKGTQIGYCEITLIGEGRSHNSQSAYLLRLEDRRIDIFVTRESAKDAFFTVQQLGLDNKDAEKAQIFGLLWVVLMPDTSWPTGVT